MHWSLQRINVPWEVFWLPSSLKTTKEKFTGSSTSCLEMQRLILTNNYSPRWVSGFLASGRRSIIFRRANDTSFFLPVDNCAAEDELVSDSIHRLGICGDFNTPWLQLIWTSSKRAWLASWQCWIRHTSWGNPAMAQTFINQFIKACGNYPATDFRTPGWVHPPMVERLDIVHLGTLRQRFAETRSSRSGQGDLLWNRSECANLLSHLQTMLPGFGDFLYPNRWVGIGTAWDMGTAKSLNRFSTIWGYFPCAVELEQLDKQDPTLFETYRELMCHFYICLDIY